MSCSDKDIIAPGTTIADFRIESLVGRGAMAAVYRALQVNLERPVALKVLPHEFATDKEFVERFFNEARAAAALSHPNIVQAYDAGITDDNICYFAMEFVEGENLLDKVERDGPLPCVMALQVMLDMARALAYGWHAQRLNHGDLKPANIMINQRGETKLADFGLAKLGDLEFDGDGIMLTPLYAAPELIQWRQEKNDCRADIYSFGATLYHLLTGDPPFPGDDPEDVMDQQVYSPLTPVIERSPQTSKAVSALVDRLLAKAPDQRPQSWDEVIQRLDALLRKSIRGSGLAVAAPAANAQEAPKIFIKSRAANSADETAPKKNNKSGGIFVAVFIALLLAANLLGLVLYWLFTGRDDDPPEPPLPPESTTTIEHPDPPATGGLTEAIPLLFDDGEPDPLEPLPPVADHDRPDELPQAPAEPEPPRPGEAGPDPPPTDQTIAAGSTADDQAIEPGRRQLIGDRYTELIYDLSRFSHLPGRDLQRLRENLEQWLQMYPEPTPEREKASFLLESVLPAVPDLIPAIVAHRHHFQGMTLPGFESRRIRTLDHDGVLLALQIDGSPGHIAHRIAWSELSHPAYYLAFVRRILAEHEMALEEKVPYLAFLTLAGSESAIRAAMEHFPPSQEARTWRRLLHDIQHAEINWRALQTWRQAESAYREGAWTTAHRRLRELRDEPNFVLTRYRQEIEAMEQETVRLVPARQAADLVDAALAAMSENPADSLLALAVAEARYGKLDYSERHTVARIRERALQHLTEERRRSDQEILSFWHLPPFVAPSGFDSEPYAWALTRHRQFVEDGQAPQIFNSLQNAYAGLAWLEAGFDSQARSRLEWLDPAEVRNLPRHHLAAFIFARQVLAWRHLARPPNNQSAVRRLVELAEDIPERRQKAIVFSLALQSAILSGHIDLEPELWPQPRDLWTEGARRELKPYILLNLGWLAETGRERRLRVLADELSANRELLADAGFLDREWLAIKTLVDHLLEGKETPEDFPADSLEALPAAAFRLFYLALTESATAESLETAQHNRLATLASASNGPLAALTWLDWLSWRLAQKIRSGRFEAATSLLDHALHLKRPELDCHYPELLLLKAGVELLDGRPTAARDTLEHLQWTTVASPTQSRLATYTPGSPTEPLTVPQNGLEDNDFWPIWLDLAAQAARPNWAAARDLAESLRRIAHYRRHRRLAAALFEYASAAESSLADQ